MKKISVLIPCYNEEASLPLLYTELVKVMDSCKFYNWEVLFVNDGSRDQTLSIIKDLRHEDSRISYVDLSRNFGKENAMLAGFDYVTGDCMVIMDADLQDPPSLIPKMLEWWEKGYDDVYAKRYDRGKESWIRKRCSLLFYAILQHSTRFEVLQNVGDFRLLDRVCIDALKKMRETERYTKGMFCWIGFKKKELIFNRGDRVAGKSNWNFGSLFNLAIEGITSFTTTPLRFSAVLGFIIAFLSLGLMLFYFLKALIWGDPIQGFPTLVVIILFLGGIQLLSIGILGEYLGRIFNESKHRPIYIAREYNGKKVD
ncbi:glycosyltransferase family 2 protein [Phocaeicola plebeius]|uniref:glycosyltransferase family 2 protein n=1 Tax=Phocaeicola plebeius TaxID=310297 RepID=UPI00201288EB|nr:glycosyltransferase family 2 protein [Phocaeicola plebeius]MCL1612066.1 glycosyltransferase family 2 protein [Phocaeicola plebeius]